MDCKTSKEMRNSIPYIAHEAAEARHERYIKRLVIAIVVAVVLMFASNALWLYAWTQYDYESYSVDYQQDGQGLNIIGDRNGVDYGPASESDTEAAD